MMDHHQKNHIAGGTCRTFRTVFSQSTELYSIEKT